MDIPAPPVMIELIAALPAGGPPVERLRDVPGVYLVGGAVRDLLLGGRPLDLDLVVEGEVAPVAERLGAPRTVHDRFGTSTVVSSGHAYDLARSRSETYSRPGALPDVRPAGLATDLQRRDFTVNAMAIGLGGEQAGQLFAVARARDDLERGLLRILHERSFRDDPTRLLRLVRYWSRLGFAVEPGTEELAASAVAQGAVDTVSRSRLGNELRLLAQEPDPVDALERARALGLDRALHPRFGLSDSGRARRAISLLSDQGRCDRLVLGAAAAGIPVPDLVRLLDEMGFQAADRDVIVAAATRADELARALARTDHPSEIAQAVGEAPPELVALAGALGPAEPAREWLHRLRGVRLEIDGGDLLAAGIPQGPAVGRGLRAALSAKLDGQVRDREAELAVALQAARAAG